MQRQFHALCSLVAMLVLAAGCSSKNQPAPELRGATFIGEVVRMDGAEVAGAYVLVLKFSKEERVVSVRERELVQQTDFIEPSLANPFGGGVRKRFTGEAVVTFSEECRYQDYHSSDCSGYRIIASRYPLGIVLERQSDDAFGIKCFLGDCMEVGRAERAQPEGGLPK